MLGYAITLFPDGTTGFRAIDSSDALAPGETFALEPPTPTLADASAQLENDVEAWLDATARGNGYRSLERCISFLGSSVAQWDADARAALAWRDAVWLACFQQQQDAYTNPPAVLPTSSEVIASLPKPEQFGWIVHTPGASA